MRIDLNSSQVRLISDYLADVSKAVFSISIVQISSMQEYPVIYKVAIFILSVFMTGFLLLISIQLRKYIYE